MYLQKTPTKDHKDHHPRCHLQDFDELVAKEIIDQAEDDVDDVVVAVLEEPSSTTCSLRRTAPRNHHAEVGKVIAGSFKKPSTE